MKFLCLDQDNCGFYHYLTDDEYSQVDFTKTFSLCPSCDYFMIVVEDDFSLSSNKALIEKASNKIFKILNKQNSQKKES
jgi:hypothetical protein